MLTKAEKQEIIDSYAPVAGDSQETARRMAAWSWQFFGDPMNKAHRWIRTNTIPDVHYKIYEALSQEHKFIAVTSPRGFAKTTIDSLFYPLYRIYYSLDPTIVIIGKVEGSAKRILRNIKRELSQNLKLREIYGDMKPETDRKSDGLWSAHEIKTRNGIFVRSIGMGGDIRGSLDSMYRPTLIIIDDPQSKKTMREPATLEAHEEYFDSDVVYALDEEHGKIRFMGNLLGRGCLLEKVIKRPRFKVVSFSAIMNEDGTPCKNVEQIKKGKSIWEEKFPTKVLRAEAIEMFGEGKFPIFMAERQNIITDEYSKNLKGYRFHNLNYQRLNDQNVLVGDEYPDPIRVNTFLTIDPAFAETKNADERALIVFSKARIWRSVRYGNPIPFNCMWVLEYIYNHMPPHLIIEKTLELHRRYYFDSVIIEAIGGAQMYEPMLDEARMQDSFYANNPFSPVMVKYQPQNKKDRIYSGLQPRMKLSQIFIREEMTELIDECENFETYESPHLLDGLEMGNRYSHECVESFSNFNSVQRRFIQKEREPQGLAPRTLERALGVG